MLQPSGNGGKRERLSGIKVSEKVKGRVIVPPTDMRPNDVPTIDSEKLHLILSVVESENRVNKVNKVSKVVITVIRIVIIAAALAAVMIYLIR